MSILLDESSRVVIQGISGKEGSFHTRQALKFGTSVVAGVSPGKGGTDFDGIRVYDRVIDAVEKEGANISGIYVPAVSAPDAILEACEAGIKTIICMTEGIPVLDMVKVKTILVRYGCRLIGPNSPGITTPGIGKIGFMPNFIHKEGRVGVVSRSGTLTYEIINCLTTLGIGQSTSVGIGGDSIVGSTFVDILELFENDPQTDVIVLIGEVGGTAEEDAALFIRDHVKKPVVAFVAGRTVPPDRRMGHAGAIVARGKGTAEAKIMALREGGVKVVENPVDIGETVKEILKRIGNIKNEK